MLDQFERFHSCAPRARFVTPNSYAPLGAKSQAQADEADRQDALSTLVKWGRDLAERGKIIGSVIAVCQTSLSAGDRTLSPLVMLIAESADSAPVTVHLAYRQRSDGRFEFTSEEIVRPSPGLVFVKN